MGIHIPAQWMGVRCKLIQVAGGEKKPTIRPNEKEIPLAFRYNPGKTGQVFNINKTSYYTNAEQTGGKTLTKKIEDYAQNAERKQIRNESKHIARKKFQGKQLSLKAKDNCEVRVAITKKGIEESISHPHKFYNIKSLLLQNLDEVFANAIFVETVPSHTPEFKYFHYYLFKINDMKF